MTLSNYTRVTGKEYFVESSGISNAIDNSTLGIVAEQSSDENNRMVLKGVLCTVLDEKNINGRIYTTETMQDAIDFAKECHAFDDRKFLCAADDHPVTDFVPPSRASHIVTDAYIKNIDGKNYLLADILVLKTSNGRDLEELIKSGASIGTSIRGFGNLNQQTKEVEDYEFVGFDFVGDPSAGTFIKAPSTMTVESVEVDSKTRVVESNEKASDDDAKHVNTTSADNYVPVIGICSTDFDDKQLLVNGTTDSFETNTNNNKREDNPMDFELELLKMEQRSKGKPMTEANLQELVTLKNKCVLEHKMNPDELEKNETYSRMWNECVNAVRSSGVAKVEAQLAESKDLCNKSKEMLRKVMSESTKQLEAVRAIAKKAVTERRDAMAQLRKLQKESVSIDFADRHLMSECRKVAREANKEMRKAVSHYRMVEKRMNARSLVMKVMKAAK